MFQIHAVTVNEPATERGIDLKMGNITKNKLHKVTDKIPRIMVEVTDPPHFLLFHS
jgi:hypothetical protein